ncbi:22384_t:CDS:2 [Gigaspora rosea]|nr:22384_t:CDS:2 [Gigaspora rosea]
MDNVENVIDYWTHEKMLNAIPMLSPIGELNTSNNENVGKLFFTLSGKTYSCSASVIDTDDGNTGITAAHCLYSIKEGQYSTNVIFAPGYNNGSPSALGKIPVDVGSVPKSYRDSKLDDYAAIKFDYPGKLKFQTGSFGWGLTPPSPVSIAIFGYPVNGDLINCPRNGKNYCIWRGDSTLESIKFPKTTLAWKVPIYIGSGASGGPWVMKNSLPNYLGYLIGVTGYHVGRKNKGFNQYADAMNFTLIRILIDWP